MANFLAIDGNYSSVFGTSASAPVVASMITLINDARIAAGKNSVGFLNPTVCFSSFHSWTLKLNDL
jgi:tripeptidyl-peptidase-1